jgi:hypothetical protein
VLTLTRTSRGGDSGELAAAVATGGVIHPPGYPLYALLGNLFVLLPHGTLAWRMNLMSAACDAGAAGEAADLFVGARHELMTSSGTSSRAERRINAATTVAREARGLVMRREPGW